tara:strand:+ start:1466 stop:1663 length:198 start_codon:yes stop_codon:yes gene_type:complete
MIEEALIKKLEGDIVQLETNIKIYLTSPTSTIADHIDYVGTVEKELEKLSSAKGKLVSLKNISKD